MEMENKRGIPKTSEDRKKITIGIVDQVLRGMVNDEVVSEYRSINRDVYPKDKSEFIPSFILVYRRKEFGLFVANGQQEFTKMGQRMEYNSLVLNIFKGEKIMSSDEIASFLESKLRRAKRTEKRIERLIKG